METKEIKREPCIIRKNTEELRKRLKAMGYQLMNSGGTTLDAHNYDGCGHHKTIEEGTAIITYESNHCGVVYYIDSVSLKGRIDCGINEDLFIAIAALRDDTDKNQWFIPPEGCWVYNKGYESILEVSDKWRKATVNELIEYFKEKGG